MKFSSSPKRPQSWTEMRLVDVCSTFTSGGTPSRKRPEFFADGSIPWVKTKELNDGVVTEVEEFITPEAVKNSSAKILPKNTVLLAMYGATVGKLGVLGIDAACNQACAAMVPKSGVVDFKFLYYLLMQHREEIIGQATGGAQQNLSGELIMGFTFDFPTFQEQQAIAKSLWLLDEKIAINRAMSKKLENIAQTIFKSWFIDFDPVKAKMAEEKPVGMDYATAVLFPSSMEDSELGPIPKSWGCKTADTIFSVGIGRTPPRKEPEWFCKGGHGIDWVSIRDMGSYGVFSEGTSEGLTEEAIEKFRVPIVPKGTVLMSFKLTVGKLCITNSGLVTNEAIAHFKINASSPLSSFFAYLWLSNHDMESMDSTSSIGTATNSGLVKSIKFLVPSSEVLKKFETVVSPLFNQIENLTAQSGKLLELRDSLIPRLMSGELRIPEDLLAS